MNVYDEKGQPVFVGHVHLPVFIRPQLASMIMKKRPDAPGRFDTSLVCV